MNRLIYFGTSGCYTHDTTVIKGDFSQKESVRIARTIGTDHVIGFVWDRWIYDHAPVLLHVDNYSVYAVPLSRDVSGGDCITALITDFDTRLTADDFKAEIEKSEFLTKQFDI
jgi:hypothetical protein